MILLILREENKVYLLQSRCVTQCNNFIIVQNSTLSIHALYMYNVSNNFLICNVTFYAS